VRRRTLLAGLGALAALTACGRQGPFKLGFLAGLSGRTAVTSEDGRNGTILAVEQVNLAGGIGGQPVELLVQDNGEDAQAARGAMQALVAAGVQATVGPFSSTVVQELLPLAEKAGVLMISPAATAAVLAGRDDAFVMLNPSTRELARAYAELLWRRGQHRLAVATATDARNGLYATAWRDDFCRRFADLGGVVTAQQGFASDASTAYGEVVRALLDSRPDGLVFACGSVDAVRLAQQARKQAPEMPVTVAESAGGEALIALGGTAVEGIVAGQLHDRSSRVPRYLDFVDAYQARFGRVPGYHAVLSHDAVTVLAQAQARRNNGESLKQAVLRHGPYDGLQQPIVLDAFGDTARAPFFVVVRGGRFEPLR
jgi:branched-chain amino acid transport system substrate-binding protein